MDLRTLADIDGYERSRVEANAPLPPPDPYHLGCLSLEPNAGVCCATGASRLGMRVCTYTTGGDDAME